MKSFKVDFYDVGDAGDKRTAVTYARDAEEAQWNVRRQYEVGGNEVVIVSVR